MRLLDLGRHDLLIRVHPDQQTIVAWHVNRLRGALQGVAQLDAACIELCRRLALACVVRDQTVKNACTRKHTGSVVSLDTRLRSARSAALRVLCLHTHVCEWRSLTCAHVPPQGAVWLPVHALIGQAPRKPRFFNAAQRAEGALRRQACGENAAPAAARAPDRVTHC